MAFDYSNILAVSTTLIDDFGKTVTVRQERSDTDKTNPWEGKTDDVQTYATKAVFDKFIGLDIDGTIVKKDDLIAYISPDDEAFEIKIKDQIVAGSTTYKIMSVEKVDPGDTNLLYILQLRQ